MILVIIICVLLYFYFSRKNQTATPTPSVNHPSLKIKPIKTNQAFVSYQALPNNTHSEYFVVNDFTVIDFETANMYPDSICQVGLTVVSNNQIVETLTYYVRPPYNDFRNKKIHGISLYHVETAPTFLELWDTIKPFIENKFIAAYNLPFDLGCLEATLNNFNIPSPDYAAFDILANTKRQYRNLKNHKLGTVVNHLGIALDKAHDAGSDSLATAKVQIELNKIENFTSLVFFKTQNERVLHEMKFNVLTADQAWQIAQKLSANKSTTDFSEIIRYYDLAVSKSCTDAKMYRSYGELLEALGNFNGALFLYQKALSLNDKIGLKLKVNKMLNSYK